MNSHTSRLFYLNLLPSIQALKYWTLFASDFQVNSISASSVSKLTVTRILALMKIVMVSPVTLCKGDVITMETTPTRRCIRKFWSLSIMWTKLFSFANTSIDKTDINTNRRPTCYKTFVIFTSLFKLSYATTDSTENFSGSILIKPAKMKTKGKGIFTTKNSFFFFSRRYSLGPQKTQKEIKKNQQWWEQSQRRAIVCVSFYFVKDERKNMQRQF